MIALLLAALMPTAHAVEVTIDVDSAAAQAAGLDPAQVESAIADAATSQLNLAAHQAWLSDMVQAAALSARGMGVDYATNPQRFWVGGSLGSAVHGDRYRLSRDPEELPEGGFAFQAMAAAGVNLGILSGKKSFLRRFVASVNGMSVANSKEPFAGRLYNYGAHLQFKVINRPVTAGVVEWGGLDLTGGYEVATYRLGLGAELPVATDGLAWTATGTYDVRSEVDSVPIELSTNLRLLAATLYAGVAYDLNLSGDVTSTIELGGPIEAEVNGDTYELGTVTISHSDRATPPEASQRLFAGVQANVLMVKAYAHVNATLDGSYGGQFGLRVAM